MTNDNKWNGEIICCPELEEIRSKCTEAEFRAYLGLKVEAVLAEEIATGKGTLEKCDADGVPDPTGDHYQNPRLRPTKQ